MNRTVIPNGDYYYFNPIAVIFTNYAGTALYSYRYESKLQGNMNLITGLWKTIEHMFDELFEEELQVWSLNDYKIKRDIISGQYKLIVYLVFEGNIEFAERFLTQLLRNLLENKAMLFSTIMSNRDHKKLDELVKQ